jgi:hypothetical protein
LAVASIANTSLSGSAKRTAVFYCLRMRIAMLVAAVIAFAPSSATPMEFTIASDKLMAKGEIIDGDAQRFAKVIVAAPKDEMDNYAVVASLESPGGDMFEGMRLGAAIRAAHVPTLVERGKTCASACALAFLGGSSRGVMPGAAVMRELEPGSHLAFHGYRAAAADVRLVNETLDAARVINAIVLEYADRMGSVDLGVLAGLLNIPPEKVEVIDTPFEIAAFNIQVTGNPPKPPKGWAKNACRAAVAARVSPLDALGADRRLKGEPEPMPNLVAFRDRFLDDKYPAAMPKVKAIRDAVLKLPAGDGLNLLAGEALYADLGKVGAWRILLERGMGFYFDSCFAVTDFTSIRTILVDGVSPLTIVTTTPTLAGFPANKPLW